MQKMFRWLFASIWTSITCPIFPSNFLFGFSDYPLKIEYLKNPFFATFLIEKWPIWAVSSAGRARRSHRRGRGFDPLTVHQNWKSPQWELRRFSRLTTEVPQTDFCFDHLKGTPFRKECPSFVYCGVNSAYYFSLSNAFLIFVMWFLVPLLMDSCEPNSFVARWTYDRKFPECHFCVPFAWVIQPPFAPLTE